MKEEYQIQVETIVNEFKRKENVNLTEYLVECIEKTLKDSYKINKEEK